MFQLLCGMQDWWHNVLHSKVLRSMLLNWIQEELFSNNPTQIFNSIQFVINKESGQETILSELCFVSKAGVLNSKFAYPPCHNDLSLAFLIMC